MTASTQPQMNYQGSNKSLSKCNSSPLSSFIKKSTSKLPNPSMSNNASLHQAQINYSNYNSTKHYREVDEYNDQIDPQKFVYKSNSQKSINWEGTPQNHTHQSINNKNVNSQSQKSVFSTGKLQNSSRKLLMPSGSSGTLMRKEIIEMDEVNSSSSSSIGKEKNAHQVVQTSSRIQKAKIKQKDIVVSKLNFTGKPFAPDSIFLSNMGKNLGDDDDGAEFENIQELSPRSIAEGQQASQSIVQAIPSSNSESSLKRLPVATPANTSSQQNIKSQYATVSIHQLAIQSIPSQKQTLKVSKKLKAGISAVGNKQNLVERNPSPGHKMRAKDQSSRTTLPSQAATGRSSMNPQVLQSTISNDPLWNKLKARPGKIGQKVGVTANLYDQVKANENKFSQTQKLKVSFVEPNNTQTQNSRYEDQKQGIIPIQGEKKTQVLSGVIAAKTIQNSKTIGYSQKQKKVQSSLQTVDSQKLNQLRKTSNNSITDSDKIQTKVSSMSHFYYRSNNSPKQQYPYSRMSPAEKMIESHLSSVNYYKDIKEMPLTGGTATPNKQIVTRKHQLGKGVPTNLKTTHSDHKEVIRSINLESGRFSQLSNGRLELANSSIDQKDWSNSITNSKYVVMVHKPPTSMEEQEEYDVLFHEEVEIDAYGSPLKQGQLTNRSQQMQQSASSSKSNKIPSSLAFKRKSHDSNTDSYKDQRIEAKSDQRLIMSKNGSKSIFEKHPQIMEDDQNLTSRRNPLDNMFSLKNKDELNRNIPFTKFSIDFSGMTPDQAAQRSKLDNRCPLILTQLSSLQHCVMYLDFDNLLKVMSLIKDFREDFKKSPSDYQAKAFKIFKAQLKVLLTLGLPSTLQRIQYWNFRTKFFYGKKKKPNLYKTLKSQQTNECVADIRKDVYRTFPNLSFFQKPQQGQSKLFNILNAVAQQNVKTGYIQGMNFLAGTILINLHKEEETFWMMMSILNKYKFDSILDLKNGGLFQILCYQLDMLMDAYLPKLASHLQKVKVPTDIYAANWFITMFCYDLSIDLVLCILDVFLLEGKKSLIRVSLALLSFLEEKLLEMNYEECMEFLSHSSKDINVDSQTLIETAFSFKITNSLLSDLELFYKVKNKQPKYKILKAFNRLALQEELIPSSGKKKLHWVVMPATPDDLQELFRKNKDLSEDEIQIFYQENLKHRRLREIVEELQIEEDSEIGNINSYVLGKKDILNSKTLQASKRKKETLHGRYAENASQQKKRGKNFVHFNTDSNNTIAELTNDFSGGHSSGVAKMNSVATSQLSVGGEMYKVHMQGEVSQLHQSVVMKPLENMLITPRGHSSNRGENMFLKASVSSQANLLQDKKSPFVQIGSKIKSIFGNFFKTSEKLNKSYEESTSDLNSDNHVVPLQEIQENINEDHSKNRGLDKKQIRSKSIHHGDDLGTATIDPRQENISKTNKLHAKERHLQVTTEDCHNVPNGNLLFFNTTTHLNQVSKALQNSYFPASSKLSMSEKRANKKATSSSVEHNMESSATEFPNVEDCEVDLLSNSDYAIAPVTDNVLRRNNGATEPKSGNKPMIMITKDLVAGDSLANHSQLNPSYSHQKVSQLSSMSSYVEQSSIFNIKHNNSGVSSYLHKKQAGIPNIKSTTPYNFNQHHQQFGKSSTNSKVMKASPPVSPKDASQPNNTIVFTKVGPMKTSQLLSSKRK